MMKRDFLITIIFTSEWLQSLVILQLLNTARSHILTFTYYLLSLTTVLWGEVLLYPCNVKKLKLGESKWFAHGHGVSGWWS